MPHVLVNYIRQTSNTANLCRALGWNCSRILEHIRANAYHSENLTTLHEPSNASRFRVVYLKNAKPKSACVPRRRCWTDNATPNNCFKTTINTSNRVASPAATEFQRMPRCALAWNRLGQANAMRFAPSLQQFAQWPRQPWCWPYWTTRRAHTRRRPTWRRSEGSACRRGS